MTTVNAMSQRAAREGLSSPDNFKGGVYVTKNGSPELFIQTAEERAIELAQQESEREKKALLRLVTLAKQDIENGKTLSVSQMRERLRNART